MSRFTIVFEGDLAAIKGNPFKVETVFGKPVTIADSDLAEEIELLEQRLEFAEWEWNRATEALKKVLDANNCPYTARYVHRTPDFSEAGGF